jgi:hypothetical protein
MPKPRSPQSAEEILALVRGLPPQERQKVRRGLDKIPARDSFAGAVWVTVSEAAMYSGKSRSQVCRDCQHNKLPTNGGQWRDLRICLWGVMTVAARDAAKAVRRALLFSEDYNPYDVCSMAEKLKRQVLSLRPGRERRVCPLANEFAVLLEHMLDLATEAREIRRAGRCPKDALAQAESWVLRDLVRAFYAAEGVLAGFIRLAGRET